MKFCLLSFFLCLPLSVFGQQVTIAPYYGGRQAALSLTFDDGLLDQYTLAFPQLKSRGLKATFAIIGSKVGVSYVPNKTALTIPTALPSSPCIPPCPRRSSYIH